MMARYKLVVAAIVLALAQIGFLGWMIVGRAAILRDGKEVLLKVEPVDPRDLLRGDYVRLGYDISRIEVEKIANLPQGEAATAEGPIIVRLKKDADGFWRATSAWLGAATTPAPGDEVDLLGQVSSGWSLTPGSTISVDYGIERFYVPEGEGLAIEEEMRKRNSGAEPELRSFGIKVAVAEDGSGQIKALMDGDTMLFEEPLY
ncbi:GDYXXLXY domain-containing protein [Aminobacter anthyllidis]|uniref:GDYXXLXY domain-containing protein n=1 Tax=Aminobacter anthyllidis TaxID=1035067 RepID=A0A9X1D3W1_9HYPH|nr:GDYXXLXY domain-containing protein [Aminobacter anthyllidis]MBT1154306.1 GDYXXLXY domain-containing protein [Aminobacter anthyllidis]MDH4985114.1 GDYXXLXY domain-containing protein [Aminobacter anthyllidis]